MKNILVTGGAGYIGSHTCKSLSQSGFTPVVIDNLIYGHERAVKWGPFIEADILDRNMLHNIFSHYSPEAVIHFAAFAYVGESVINPAKYYYNNVTGTLALLEAMRKFGCLHLVFSSSCAVYGTPEEIPIVESTPLNPINPYGRSKLMAETIMEDYDSAYGFKHGILRYFNAAGADPDGELGEHHTPETHLIPLTINAGLGTAPPLQIFGDNYQTHDGSAIRDYIHVTDLADAHVKALYHLRENNRSFKANLGTGAGISVKEIVAHTEKILGQKIPYGISHKRSGDPAELVADANLAYSLLKWKPFHSNIETIIQTAVDWQRSCCTNDTTIK